MKKSKVKRFLSVLVCLILALSVMVLPYGCSDSGGPAEGEYTITFDSMGGTEIAPITVAAGAYAEKPDNPTKDGHIFKGWYLDLSDTESGSFLFDETPITQNIQLYALWQIRTFKVSFLDDSGNEIIPSATYDWGSLLEEPDTDSLEKDGFVIKWYKENGDLWDFATSKVISNTTLTLRYISNKDSYIGKEVADNFYPTYDKIITDPEMCSETYNEDTDTVSYTYDGLNLQQVALYLELDTLEYSSVSVVARAADSEGVYDPNGTFSQLRAYIKTDAGGNISYNDEPSSGYPPAYYYIQSTGVNAGLFSSSTEGDWTTFTFDLASLKYWQDAVRLDAFAFGFVSQSLGIEIKSIVFNKVDKEEVFDVTFADSLGRPISGIAAQQVKWGGTAERPAAPADETGRRYTGNWLDESGNVFDFSTAIRRDTVLTPEYVIEGVYSWAGENVAKDFYPVFNNSVSNPATKTLHNGNAVFSYNNGTASTGLEQIAVDNLNLTISDYRYLTLRIRLVNADGFGYNASDVLGRVRIYLVTDAGGDLVDHVSGAYYEFTSIDYTAVTSPVDVSAKTPEGWFTVTVDLCAADDTGTPVFSHYVNGTTLKGFAFGTTTSVKALEVAEISLSEQLPQSGTVTVSFTDENGSPIDAIAAQNVPYGKAPVQPGLDLVPQKDGYDFDHWADSDDNAFSFAYGVTQNTVLHPVYVMQDWEATTVTYSGQQIVDNFTASRERYGNTISGTEPNVQYDLTLVDGAASFTYTTAMKAANKCITGLGLGMRIRDGSLLQISFRSDAFDAGTHYFSAFKIGVAFRGEDPATTILSTAANAHYFQYTKIDSGLTEGDNGAGISFNIGDDGLIVVTFDLYQLSKASESTLPPGADGNYFEGFTFLAVESVIGSTVAATDEDTIVFEKIEFVNVAQDAAA